MDTLNPITRENTMTLVAQRACCAPSNRELDLLLQGKYGRGLEDFDTDELGTARLVFAQVALMAGAALIADSETYVGAEQLWRDMQCRIGPRDRALASFFLERLAADEYYSECERRLIGSLRDALSEGGEPVAPGGADLMLQVHATTIDELPVLARDAGGEGAVERETQGSRGDAPFSICLDEARTEVQTQRAGFAPSTRELRLMLGKEYGRDLEDFEARDLAIARVVFAQVSLMAGAALAADSETYSGAERLWRELREKIDFRDRMLATHFCELLSRDEYYSDSERHLIASLAEALTEGETAQVSPAQMARAAHLDARSARIDARARRYYN
ncbi:MAG: hypothetical protein A3H34_07610 [Betaproteobacteria bacterium RIFCSPLOWO2_02_FULL_67_19]|nr:MAG: hypothetical protein A3H34_07610 [Betaproteobacteria bacterium RIFCSPLOWO2_02_FULL_67_19]